MIDERILLELKRRRELIVRKIEIYKAEKAGLLGRQYYYDDEVQRLLDVGKKGKNFEKIDFIEKKLVELERKAKKINRVLLNVKEKDIEAKGEEKKSNETKFLIVFLALLAITSIFLFSDYLKLEFGPTGFVISRGTTNITGQQPRSSIIGGNVTIELRAGDIIPNDTLVNVSFEGQENTTYLEYFIRTSNELLSGSVEPNSSTSPFIDVDAVRTWEGITGYGWSVNETPTSQFDGGNITVNLDDLFPTGLIAPSVGGVYDLILNATLENETGELVVTSTTQIDVAAIPDDPTFMNVNSTAANAQNYTNETLNFNAFVNDANINDVLTCHVNPYIDGVNQTANEDSKSCTDPESFVYEWDSANTTEGQLHSFALIVCDSGGDCSGVVFSDNLTIINAPPSQPLLNLPENNTQIEEGIFTVELNWSNSTDVEGSSLTYYLEIWNDSIATQIMYVNSSITETDNTTEDLVTFPSETKDYFWRVLANDGTDNSSFSDLRNISLRVSSNTAPNDPIGVIINSTTADQLNQTNETLDMNFYCDDPEADTMNWNLLSFKDGIEQFNLKGTCADNVYTVVKLEDANTSVSEEWSFGIIVDDGTLNNTGGYIYSNNLTIENTGPSISDVSLGGQTWSPLEGDIRIIEVSFLADDIDGADHLDNATAKLNASYFSITDNTLLSNENSSCSSSSIDTDTINYTCEIRMQYFWDPTSTLAQGWTVDAEIADINSSFALNSSNKNDGTNWTYSELIAANLSGTSLAWDTVIPTDTNKTSTTNLTWENTGNSLSLNIVSTLIDLGASGTSTYIPAGNFSIFNITNTDFAECLLKNQTAAVTPGVEPLVGINNTAIRHLTNALKRGGGSGNFGLTNICLFDVPAELITAEYNTSFGGSWTIVEEDSGE